MSPSESSKSDASSNGMCSICCNDYTRYKRACVCCVSVACESIENPDSRYCTECLRTYIKSRSPEEPHCPCCKAVMDVGFLNNVLGQTFVKGDLATISRETTYQQQKADLPGTQEQAKTLKTLLSLHDRIPDMIESLDELIQCLKDRKGELRVIKGNIVSTMKTYDISAQTNRVATTYGNGDTIGDLIDAMKVTSTAIEGMHNSTYREEDAAPAAAGTVAKTAIVRACPDSECRGFLGQDWVCETCDTEVCKECSHPIDPEDQKHECDPDEIETEKLKRSTTKPCPNPDCGVVSEKTEGCDQVWCRVCRKPWSWRQHAILTTTNIHSVDYLNWRRDQFMSMNDPYDDNDGNVPCDIGLSLGRVQKIAKLRFGNGRRINYILAWYVFSRQLGGEEQEFQDEDIDVNDDLKVLRIKYLNSAPPESATLHKYFGNLTLDQFKSRSHSVMNRHRCENQMRALKVTFVAMVNDILYRYVESCTPYASKDMSNADRAPWMACMADTIQYLEDAARYLNARIFERIRGYVSSHVSLIKFHGSKNTDNVCMEDISIGAAGEWYADNVPAEMKSDLILTRLKRKRTPEENSQKKRSKLEQEDHAELPILSRSL